MGWMCHVEEAHSENVLNKNLTDLIWTKSIYISLNILQEYLDYRKFK